MIQAIVYAVPEKLFQYMHILYKNDKTPKIKPRSKGDCGALLPNDSNMMELAARVVLLIWKDFAQTTSNLIPTLAVTPQMTNYRLKSVRPWYFLIDFG